MQHDMYKNPFLSGSSFIGETCVLIYIEKTDESELLSQVLCLFSLSKRCRKTHERWERNSI